VTVPILDAPPTAAAVEQPRTSRLGWLVDLALVAALIALAAWVRWPDLYTVPAITDEADEMLLALRHWRSGDLPLVNVNPFIGPLWNWLLMLAFSIAGPSPFIGRTLVFLAGCATVGLTYCLGRAIGGRWVGLVAGALLTPHIAHVLIVSHIGWSNCLSPLLAAATLLTVIIALKRNRPALLPLAGLLGGLTLQTHASTAPVLIALALAVLADPVGRRWLRTRWPIAGLLGAIVGYAPVLAYMTQHPFGALRTAQDHEYAFHPATSPADFFRDVTGLLISLGRGLASVMEQPASLAELLARPQVAPLALLLIVGAIVAWRRGRRELPIVLLVSPLITAYVGGDYRWLPSSVPRYLGPLWPVCCVLIGLGAVALAGCAWRSLPRLASSRGWPAVAHLRWPALAALALVIAGPGLYGPWRAGVDYREW
jgi:4-amino-4-deoxy-L-arabinose transferase-like glycosyltransferase